MSRFPCVSRCRIGLTCCLLVAAAETRQRVRKRRSSAAASTAPALEYESAQEAMFCEGFDRGGNDDKRIPDAAVRARYEGKAESVTYVDPQGKTTTMKRLGAPKDLY